MGAKNAATIPQRIYEKLRGVPKNQINAYVVTAPFFWDLDPVPILLTKIGTSSVPFP